MELTSETVSLKRVNANISELLLNDEKIIISTPIVKLPFGLEQNSYGKYLMKLELSDDSSEQLNFYTIVRNLEEIVKEKLGLEDNEFMSAIHERENYNPIIECKLKMIRNNIGTKVKYLDKENNYLKTIHDIQRNSDVKCLIEGYGYWDYREHGRGRIANKVGLLLFIKSIEVY